MNPINDSELSSLSSNAFMEEDSEPRSYSNYYHISQIVILLIVLFIDSHISNLIQQFYLGVICVFILGYFLRFHPFHECFQAIICLFVSIFFEVVGSLIWGLYTYRFHNIPVFVPLGHAGIYLFGLTFCLTPFFHRFSHFLKQAAIVLALIWAISGVTWLPLINHRFDILGACNFPIFVWLICYSRRSKFYIGTFFIISIIEFAGTTMGNWQWAKAAPYLDIPNGNPPAVISVTYAMIEYAALIVANYLSRYFKWENASSV